MGSTAINTKVRIRAKSMWQFATMGIRHLTVISPPRMDKNLATETATRASNNPDIREKGDKVHER